MKKYYADSWGNITEISIARETAKRFYIDRDQKQIPLRGRHSLWQTYLSRDDPHLFNTARDALEYLIREGWSKFRRAERAMVQERTEAERLESLRDKEPFGP